jgi:hypothetical protein
VVAVIEEKEMAGTARYIEFKVYQSPTTPNRVLGSWRFAVGGPRGTVIDPIFADEKGLALQPDSDRRDRRLLQRRAKPPPRRRRVAVSSLIAGKSAFLAS